MHRKFSRRLLLASILAALIAAPAAARQPPKAPTILFVCQYGTVKSPIARELLRRRAAERGIPVNVSARGITPERHLPVDLSKRLAAEGINPASEPLKRLRQHDVAAAEVLIAFDPIPSGFKPRRLIDWSDTPSMIGDYARARSELDARIDRLLDGLSKNR